MRKKWIAILLAALLIIALLIVFGRGGKVKGVEVKTSNIALGDITAVFSSSGTIESKSRKEYTLTTPSKVVKLYKNIGDRVKKGDRLAEFEVQDLSTQLKTAQLQYENALLQLKALKDKRDRIKANPGSMYAGGPTGDIDSDVKILENQTEVSRLNVENIKKNIENQVKYITADFDGVLTAVNLKEGSMSQVQLPAIVLEDDSKLQVSLNINQFDISRIKEGQQVNIKFDNKVFKGKVSFISPSAAKVVSASGSDTVIRVLVDIVENDGTLKSGFDVDADIVTGEKKGVLKVPAEAIVTDKEDKERVYVVEEGKAVEKYIKTGLSSDMESEIVEGLKEGDKVILNPTSNISNGVLVLEKGVGK